MTILVTGANGFVGSHLCDALINNGDSIRAVVRKQIGELKDVELFIKELNSKTNWQDVLQDIDIVIHLAGRAHVMKEDGEDSYNAYADTNIYASKHLAEQAASAGVKRFIFLSSIKVNGESTGNDAFTEKQIPQPEDDYGKTKHEAEKYLHKISLDTKMEVVIIRPPLIYGKGVKANFKSLIKLCLRNIPLPFGAIHNKRSFIYIENLISFIYLCTSHPKAANQTFLISDDEDISTTKLIQTIKQASGKKPWLIPIPQKWVVTLFNLIGQSSLSDRLCGNLQLNISKAKTLLNWNPPYTIKDGIRKTVGD